MAEFYPRDPAATTAALWRVRGTRDVVCFERGVIAKLTLKDNSCRDAVVGQFARVGVMAEGSF
jgi:hypothetical protein